MKFYEIRDPIYGFIGLNELEMDIVNHPVFQRLRRIKQLGFTEMVYPSAKHSRFEHSLGVMDLATRLYDGIVKKNSHILKETIGLDCGELDRDRELIRLAALLHDIGHTPFSHVGESLMPTNPKTSKPYKHEHYSAAIIKEIFKDVIEDHEASVYNIKARDVAALIEGDEEILKTRFFWKVLISGQLDADRGDYLLRDSYHAGVKYGIYDVDRLINTITIGEDPETTDPILAIEDGGWHVAESLVISRYHMFTQIYFHKTRRAYDYHLTKALEDILPGKKFPPPEELEDFLKWDDWTVGYKILNSGQEDCKRIKERDHLRMVYETPEKPTKVDLNKFEKAKEVLENIVTYEDEAKNSWYKFTTTEGGDVEIYIKKENDTISPLSEYSTIVKEIGGIRQKRLYVPPEEKNNAKNKLIKEGLL